MEDLKREVCKTFPSRDLGEVKRIVGVDVTRDDNGSVAISQQEHIDDMLQRFRMTECKAVSTPMDCGTTNSLKLNPDEEHRGKEVPYREAIGTLMYLTQASRPDITYAVCKLARYVENLTSEHWQCVKRVFRYLQGTKNLELKYEAGPCQLQAYVDADWAGSQEDRKSTTGYCLTLGKTPIS